MMTFAATIIQFTVIIIVSSGTTAGFNPFGDVVKQFKMEVAAVAHPVQSLAMGSLSKHCDLLKGTFGVQYSQMKGAAEPDIRALTLQFKDRLERKAFKIMTASVEIPKHRTYRHNETLVIFVHGFIDDPSMFGFKKINDAFQKIGLFNVLALDGSPLIRWLYLRSTTYVRFIGEKLGEVLAALVKGGLDPKKVHMIGHSLGSHISAFTGKTFYNKTGKRIGRISGLDPAGPCFVNVDENLRLQKTDADFVDVMHTDAGVFGLTKPVGHVDFFPNGGSKQPGCVIPSCDHLRAWMYYAASVVQPDAFPAVKCKDWEAFKRGECEQEISNMGYGCPPTARGSYYLQTGESYPYGLGTNGTAYDKKEAVVDIVFAKARSLF